MLKKILLGLGLTLSLSAAANTIIIGTRVVYPSDQKSINVQLQNKGTYPSLIQAWVDEGDPNSTPNNTKSPFVVTPPMIRVEPKAGQTLRLMFTGKDLPKDRETVFYLNVLDVPPKPKAEDLGDAQNYLQFAVRNRLKVFYRPTSLTMSISDAYQKVVWRHLGGNQVEIDNPTPYYITYRAVQIGKQMSETLDMISPFGKLKVNVPNSKKGDKVEWKIVTDYGGDANGESTLQ